MIKASELRIGNWYNTPNMIGELSPEQFTDYSNALEVEYKGEPILLTPEILEKSGFKQSETKFTWDYNKLSIHLPSISYKHGRTYFNSWCIIEHGIKYLHQLQNLYYCLTGEELPIRITEP